MDKENYRINAVLPKLWGACWEAVVHTTKTDNDTWTVVNLMGHIEKNWAGYVRPDGKVLDYPETFFAIEGRNYAYLMAIADRIDDEMAAGRKVIVHCRQGIDRTSYVLATYIFNYLPFGEDRSPKYRKQKIIEYLRQNYRECAFRDKGFERSFMSMPEPFLSGGEFVRSSKASDVSYNQI